MPLPAQSQDWTSCSICYHAFSSDNQPLSLVCGHVVCKPCSDKLNLRECHLDQTVLTIPVQDLPVNTALLLLMGERLPATTETKPLKHSLGDDVGVYEEVTRSLNQLADFLHTIIPADDYEDTTESVLSKPVQRKIVYLLTSQLLDEEGRARSCRAARSIGERLVSELILLHQNQQQLSAYLWAAVRARGCQFLGPAMQEEVVGLVLSGLSDGAAMSRKVLVLYVVQRLETHYPHASKTAIGHVVQLLYRASCFKVTKREDESSLMQLKEEFLTYDSLRGEHDSQIVQIAQEAGLRISPEQWSCLLYGGTMYKSHMQTIIDRLQTPESFAQSINELMIALQRNNDVSDLSSLRNHFEILAAVDPFSDATCPPWSVVKQVLESVCVVIKTFSLYLQTNTTKRQPEASSRDRKSVV